MKQILNKKYFVYILCIITLSFELVGCGTKPTIITSPLMNTIVNEPYEYRVEAQGTAPIEFSTPAAPDGFHVDKNGVATWKPDETGQFTVLIAARNSRGEDQQSFSINVEEKPIPEQYLKGVEWGRRIWTEDRFIYTLIKNLNEEGPEYTNDPDFKKGLLDGYKEGRSSKKPEMKTDAEEIINIVVLAGSSGADFESGQLVGKKLRASEITVEQASLKKQQLILEGEAKELAWKSGFIVGYTGSGYPEHSDYALRIYFGLPD